MTTRALTLSLSFSSLLRTSIDYLSMNKNRFVDLINSQLHKPISHPEIENLPTLEIEYNRRNRWAMSAVRCARIQTRQSATKSQAHRIFFFLPLNLCLWCLFFFKCVVFFRVWFGWDGLNTIKILQIKSSSLINKRRYKRAATWNTVRISHSEAHTNISQIHSDDAHKNLEHN